MCTKNRRQLRALDEVANILIDEWRAAHSQHGWAVGRYVIMPNHVHFFCRPERDRKSLSEFAGFWKSYASRKINAIGLSRPAVAAGVDRGCACGWPHLRLARSSPSAATMLWQLEFFDHVLRSNESYSEKWNYVRANPVRSGGMEIRRRD
jgi:REP element-mobilizing transposase RayT